MQGRDWKRACQLVHVGHSICRNN